jgi:hypothetical protein
MSDVDEVLELIEQQMNNGVSRLKVQASDDLEAGKSERAYHLGRCDVGSPWAKGTVRNCDYIDMELDLEEPQQRVSDWDEPKK